MATFANGDIVAFSGSSPDELKAIGRALFEHSPNRDGLGVDVMLVSGEVDDLLRSTGVPIAALLFQLLWQAGGEAVSRKLVSCRYDQTNHRFRAGLSIEPS